ncbi:amino acid adenylation domain-containing protein, partial [Azoarcus indigens]|nr:amino acid adenylation domain-containing protein [Azoarcus indigens]
MSDLHQDLSQRRARLSPEQRARLNELLRGADAAGSADADAAIAPRAAGEPAPLSFAQLRQWFLWKLEPESTAYHVGGGLKFAGALDVEALRAGVSAVVDRHEALRTVFEEDGEGGATQRVLPAAGFELQTLALHRLPEAERAARLAEERAAITGTPFDLTRGPLLRMSLLQTGEREWQLLVVMHHIVSDGWSVQVVLDELAALYRAQVQGTPQALPGLPLHYADYAAWQRRWLAAGEGERQLAWWKAQLGEDQPALALAADHPRRADGSYTAAHHLLSLPGALVDTLRGRAREEGATLFMLLLAAFQGLLHRYTGQEDVRVGVPIANRNRAETAGIVGFFVNTQVLRARIAPRTRLNALLTQVRDTALGAQAHQDLPFERLVEALQPERSLSTNPLFQVMFNHLRRDHRALAGWPGVEVQRLDFDEQAAQFELTLQTCEYEDGRVDANFIYAAELFDAATVERMAGHYLALLRAFAEQRELSLDEVQLLGGAELAQLRTWGENPERFDDAQPIHRLIEARAAASPDAVAVIFGEAQLSYGELNRRANRLAHYLIGRGVGLEVKVGIAVERSLEMVVGLLAVLKAGGAYVPLDPAYPAERLGYMVEDSGIALLLTCSDVRDHVPAGPDVAILELDLLDFDGGCESPPEVAVCGGNLAYLIYTSGSTGRPKGVMVRHSSLSNFMCAMAGAPGVTAEDVLLALTSLSFDIAALELFLPLVQGASIVLATRDAVHDGGALTQLAVDHGVTVLQATPSGWRALMQGNWPLAPGKPLKGLCGGEALHPDLACSLMEGGVELWNMYGPTETTIWSAARHTQGSPAIGGAIAATQLRVLDQGLNPVPIGVPGELYLGGAGLARGYLNRPGLSAERFIADPYDEAGGRLYRTGDLVRWNAEGELEYLGRIDHQVKIRGFRIELGEVEAQLLAQPEVREAVVVAAEGPGGARLVGYVALKPEARCESGQLRSRLAASLPEYMVPAALILLERLPLNANGKVDRKALPKPELAGTQAYEAPQGEVEQALAAIWAELLGTERIGRQDGFFELGGDSILSLKLVARLHRAGFRASPRQVFEHQRLESFARTLVAATEAGSGMEGSIPVLDPAARGEGLALSYAQRRQWFLWELDRASTAYHIAGGLRLQGEVNLDALQGSFA